MLVNKLINKNENKVTKVKFRIVVNQYNEYNEVNSDVYYTVQIQKKFLWFKYWCNLEHTVSDEDCPFKEVTKFKTIEDAKEFISILKKIKTIPIH
jgi:hypothetical protein